MKTNRIGVYIDGADYYYGYEECIKRYEVNIPIKQLLKLIKKQISKKLDPDKKNKEHSKLKYSIKKYFNGKVIKENFPLINDVEGDLNANNFDLKLRDMEFYLDEKGEKRIRQKGVDVEIAVEIMNDIRKENFDILVFFGSDCDFIPLFMQLKSDKIVIVNFTFRNSSNCLSKFKLSNHVDHEIYFFHDKWKNKILKWS